MTSTSTTVSSAASGTSSSRTSRGSRSRRPRLSPAQREAADAAGAARIAALHDQIGERVEQLTADPQWRAMLDAAAKLHTYSLNNQLLIELQAARLGISSTRVGGFGTWKVLGRSVVKGSIGLAVLAPCTYRPKSTDPGQAVTRRRDGDRDGGVGGAGRRGRRPAGRGAGAARVPGRARLRHLPDRGRPAAGDPLGAADW